LDFDRIRLPPDCFTGVLLFALAKDAVVLAKGAGVVATGAFLLRNLLIIVVRGVITVVLGLEFSTGCSAGTCGGSSTGTCGGSSTGTSAGATEFCDPVKIFVKPCKIVLILHSPFIF
jgi:hypothetical protein